MKITEKQENEKIIFILEGRLDTTTAAQFQNALLPAFKKAKTIELNFRELAYVSSAGLRVLLMGQKTAKLSDVSMILRNVSDEIMEVLKMTGFTDILTIS